MKTRALFSRWLRLDMRYRVFQKLCRGSLFSALCSGNQSKYNFFKPILLFLSWLCAETVNMDVSHWAVTVGNEFSDVVSKISLKVYGGSHILIKTFRSSRSCCLNFFNMFINVCNRFPLKIIAELSWASQNCLHLVSVVFTSCTRAFTTENTGGCSECPGLKTTRMINIKTGPVPPLFISKVTPAPGWATFFCKGPNQAI